MMNQKFLEASLGMLARLIPPHEYEKATNSLNDIVKLLQTIDDRMKKIEGIAARVEKISDSVAILESVVRANVPGAEATYAEQAMWMRPGAIEEALAPSKGGSP